VINHVILLPYCATIPTYTWVSGVILFFTLQVLGDLIRKKVIDQFYYIQNTYFQAYFNVAGSFSL
jgi:hypothetical protein